MKDSGVNRRELLAKGAGALGLGALATAGITAFGGATAASADEEGDRPTIEGSWRLSVIRTEPGAPPPTTLLVTFTETGGTADASARTPTPGIGAWAKMKRREFRWTQARFLFDSAGAPKGESKADARLVLDKSGDSLAGSATIQIFDTAGTLVRSGTGTIEGARIRAEVTSRGVV
ncbi:MAG TPA: hypothetical protein VGR41_09435 [Actinomycetota bacterium]|jgi:hypothetical protein|nr:hypothetical protein [Actinomycetota bacterium]